MIITGNTTATPMNITKLNIPHIPKECTTGESSVFVFETKKTYRTEDFFAPDDVLTGTEVLVFKTYEHMDYGTEVFLVGDGGEIIKGRVEDCSPEPDENGFYHPLIEFEKILYTQQVDEFSGGVLNPIVLFETFVRDFKTVIVGSDKYEWQDKKTFLKDIDKALDGILAIQEQLIGGDAK